MAGRWVNAIHLTLIFFINSPQVIKTLKRALQPVISDVVVTWNLPKDWTVTQVPSSLPPLFLGDRLVVFGVLTRPPDSRKRDDDKDRKKMKAKATLKGTLGTKKAGIEHVIEFTVVLGKDHGQAHGDVFHCLAAESVIQEKQDGYSDASRAWDDGEKEAARDAVINVSKAANVVSKFTSFVAVDKDNHQPVSGPLKKQPGLDSDYCGMGYYGIMADDDSSDDLYECPCEVEEQYCDMGVARDGLEEELDEAVHCYLSLPRTKSLNNAAGPSSYSAIASTGGSSQQKKEAPPVLSLISLQKASGAWDLTDQLVSLCGSSRDALITGCPAEIAVDKAEGKLLWATALALVLLMGKFLDQKDDWEMIAEKGKKWMKKNLPAAVTYDKMLEAAATAVGVQI